MALMGRFLAFPLLALLAHVPVGLHAQGGGVFGTVVDSVSLAPLAFVNVVLADARDTSRWTGTSTNEEGRFRFAGLAPGNYVLKASYVGYAPLTKSFTLDGPFLRLGRLPMRATATQLDGITVEGMRTRVEQLGDTTQFNADGYKTAPDASAEDLLKKLPGITEEGGVIKAQGEEVRRVLVDGKEFFGDDPNLALKNLPAEIIEKIQVFDRLSDQAQFTGFDDGSGVKTINIITKPGMRNGMFGRLYAGHDATDLYTGGGSVNIMNGARRFSLIGMANNINQQNFSDQDLLGVSSGGGGSGGARGGRGGGGQGDWGGRGGGGAASNFLVGPQGGVVTTRSIGTNYGDKWGKRTEVTGSYFLNLTERDHRTDLVRDFVLPSDSGLFYTEEQRTDSRNLNHRANLRIEFKPDSANSFILTPRLNTQDNRSVSRIEGLNAFDTGVEDSRTLNDNVNERTGYTFNTGLNWRHRFAKRRRTFSVQADVESSDREGDRYLYSLNVFERMTDTTSLDRFTDDLTRGLRLSGRVTFTEPIGEKGMLQLNHTTAYTDGLTDRLAYELAPGSGTYTLLDTSLSNRFANTYLSHRAGTSYRLNGEKWSWSVGLDAQRATLTGDQEFPLVSGTRREFENLLPSAMLGFNPAKGTNLRVFYRTSTREPSIGQLQNVVDISNPLFLRTGNPALAQSYTHGLTLRYNRTVADKGRSLFVFAAAWLTNGHIGNSTLIASRTTVTDDGITVPAGGQISRPVNMDGALTTRTFVTYGLPVAKIKCNLNLNGGYSLNRLPSMINGLTNLADNHALGQGAMLSSNISERVDFAIGYNASWNIVRNSAQPKADNDFFSQTSTLRLQWTTKKDIVLRSNASYTLFDGLAEGVDSDYLLWTASLGRKLLKDRSLEVAVQVFDILNRNNSIARNVTDSWVEDSRTNVLGRYVMLMVTWNMRYFKKAKEGGPPARGSGE